jgi:septal ring factor EnvC (AmiA/AmiB activator)
MSLDDANAASSLGERLLQGVRNLWKTVNSQGLDIIEIEKRVASLERELHGLKVSRGRAKAKSSRLEAALTESEQKIADIRSRLN